MYSKKIVVALFFASLFSFKSFSQFTATWAFSTTTTNTGVLAGAQQTNVVIGNTTLGNAFSAASYGGSGIKCQPPTADWPTVATDGWNIDFPISPNGAVDLTLTGLTFIAKTSGSSGTNMASLAYQKDGAGAFIPFGTPQPIPGGGTNNINFGTLSRKLYSNHNYIVRLYLYAAATGVTSSRSISIKTLVYNGISATAGTQPSVTTTAANATGKYTALATGVVTAGTLLVNQSGVVWDIATNPIPTAALTTINVNGPTASGNIGASNGGDIAGLTAGTAYNTRAYVISESLDTFYGANLSFTTNAPTIPSLTTNIATNITSIKALSGGVILDSGGVGITKKGVCWNTVTGPTIALPTQTNDGIGNASFSSLLKILTPNTIYYARAFATNSVGTAYGNEVSFTTLAAQPVIITVAGNSANAIPFGDVIVNNISSVKNYTLTAASLTPAAGNITVTAPAGFEISLSSGNGFGSTLNIPYAAGVIAPTTIYVRFLPTSFGNYSGTITHTGGGAVAINIDDVTVTGRGIQNPSELSNAGTDFWTGFGYQSNMDTKPSTGSAAHISIFVATGNQASTVVVDLPNMTGTTGFPQTFTIPANTVQEITGFPIGSVDQYNTGNTADSRLYYTGITNRGIHIFSTDGVPFSTWMYTYTTNNSAGASMLFPTNTWGSNYIVQSYGGHSNTANPNAFFYVIAKDDNTSFEFTPTNDIVDSSTATIFNDGNTASMVKYHKDSTYIITLNKGQIFNAMGFIAGTGTGTTKANGLDLSGTVIKSLDCQKKLAVFSGNGRVLVEPIAGGNNKGSDNLVQQMFPKAAWGTTYFTVPTKTMEMNYFRVYVENPVTNVWVNDKTHTTALPSTQFNAQGGYYDFMSNQPNLIESDKPISVMQFITAGANNDPNIGNGGLGDPEMILLSSVQQSINNATVYSANFKNGNTGGSYINVVLKKEAIASFKIDGLQVADTGISSYSTVGVPAIYAQGVNPTIPMQDVFVKFPADTNYYYAKIRVESGLSHSLLCNYEFNATAYGMSDGESYGYNAGTSIKALTQYLSVQNPYANVSSDSIISACVGNNFKYTVNLPYKPLSMKWDFFNNTIQQPNSDTVLVTSPVPTDSFFVNGIKLYKYSLPTTYTFSGTGTFPVNITVNATNADGCSGLQTITFSIKVVNPPVADFVATFNGCPSDIVHFKDTTNGNGTAIVAWQWNFGGSNAPNTSTAQNPTATYPAAGTYNVTLRAINAIGCFKDTTKPFIIKPAPAVDSIVADNRGYDCVNRKITFKTYATANLGTVTKWYWTYSDGKKDTTTTNQDTHTFATAGNYTVSVIVETSNGCRSAALVLNQDIRKVVADFTFVTPKCVNDIITFTDASTGEAFTAPLNTRWNWSFGDAANSVSVTQNPQFAYSTAGTFNVKLITTLVATFDFCADTTTKQITIQNKLSTPVVTLDATKTTTSSLTFNWAAIANATGYQVSVDGGAWTNPSSGATGTSQVLTGLTSNSTHNVCVKALGLCPSDTACADGKTSTSTLDIFIPNTFSPNSTKDANKKLIFCGNNIANLRFVIFNQWGEKLYETNTLNPGAVSDCYAVWDGNAQGKEQPTGVYAYVATFTLTTGKVVTKKGLVNLIR